jgi:hypothetical protein
MSPTKPVKAKRERDWPAHLAINALAAKVGRAQATDTPIVLVLRGRGERKVRGLVESKRIDRKRRLSGRDGESNLLIKVDGEEHPLESIREIRRQVAR